MAQTTPVSGAPTAASADEKDWPSQATDAIVEQVTKIRDKTTGPARTAAKWAVFGAFAISLGTVALIILVIGAVRALDNYLPSSVFGETHTWAAHSILGAILLVVGLVLYVTKTKSKADTAG